MINKRIIAIMLMLCLLLTFAVQLNIVAEEQTGICTYTQDPEHIHTEECYDELGDLICENFHVHDEYYGYHKKLLPLEKSKDIYLNPNLGDDDYDTNSVSNPAKTLVRALELAGENAVIHIMDQPIDITADTILDCGFANITFRRYENYNGTIFRVLSGAKLTLSNLIISGQTNGSSYHIINVVEGQLLIGENFRIADGGIVAMSDLNAEPIALLTNPPEGMVYKLITDAPGVTEISGRLIVEAGIVQSAINYFTLDDFIAAEFELREDEDGNISLFKRSENSTYHDTIYLSGTGDDYYDGSTPQRAVKTFARAYELFNMLNAGGTLITHISVSGSLNVTNETWSGDVEIKRYKSYNGTLISVTGSLTIDGVTISNETSSGAVISIGSGKSLVVESGEINAGNGTAVLVNSNSVFTANGGTINSNGNAVIIYYAKPSDNPNIRLNGENTLIKGRIALFYEEAPKYDGAFIQITSTTVNQIYIIKIGKSTDQDLPGLVSGCNIIKPENGSDISPFANNFILETSLPYAFDAYKNNLIVYCTKAVFVNEALGSDEFTGFKPSLALKDFSLAEQLILDNAGIDTIYICDGTVNISDDTQINAPGLIIRRLNFLTSLFSVATNGSLSLMNISIDGGNGGTDSLITVSGGQLTLGNGASLHSNASYGVKISSGTFEMNAGSQITNNNLTPLANEKAGGVLVEGGTFIMNGGSISDNSTLQTGEFDQQVSLTGGIMEFKGGTISAEDESMNAIYVSYPAVLKLFDSATIDGMIFAANTVDTTSAPIVLGRPLSPQTKFTLNLPDAMVGKKVIDGTQVPADLSNFILNPSILSFRLIQSGNHINAETNMVYLAGTSATNTIKGNDANDGSSPQKAVATFGRAKQILENRNGAWIIVVDTVDVSGNEHWDLSGIRRSTMLQRGNGFDKRPIVRVPTGTSLTLSAITLDGNKNTTTAQEALVSVTGGNLIINEDTLITNAKSALDGAAINVLGGSLTINGGMISNNAARSGGGVYVNSGGRFTMFGGEITGNTASSFGGGVCIERKNGSTNPVFTMSGGSIYGNTANRGGGVASNDNTTFNLQGGEIFQNTATEHGGGVYGSFCRINMSGGEIYENSVTGYGGGVYVNGNSGLFTGTGGVIRNNTAPGRGGGIYSNYSPVLINGIKISQNSANNGGGIYLDMYYMQEPNTFTMLSGEISENTAIYGGGILSTSSIVRQVKINGGEIINNTATLHGGGIYTALASTLIANGGLVQGNTAKGSGGGIFLISANHVLNGIEISNNSTVKDGGGVYFSGGSPIITGETKIASNSAETGNGGGVYINSGVLRLEGGEIVNNTSALNGGGIFVNSNSTVTQNSGKISLNKAENGGGIYQQNGTHTMLGGELSQNEALNNGGGVFLGGGTGIFNVISGNIFDNITGNEALPVPKSAEVHFSDGTVNIRRGDCNIKGSIFVSSGKQITVTGAIINRSRIYHLLSEDVMAGLTLVMPNNILVGDASQYLRNFVLANKPLPNSTDNNYELGKGGNKIVIVSCYYIDGQSPTDGQGTSPEDSFNTLASLAPLLENETFLNIYVCGEIDVSDEKRIEAKTNDLSIIRYDGHEVHGKTYAPFLGHMFNITNTGKLTINKATISSNSNNVTGVTGSIINNNGIVELLGNASIINARSQNPGAGIYQNGVLNITGAVSIHSEVYLTQGAGTATSGGNIINITTTSMNIPPSIPISIENPYSDRVLVAYPSTVSASELLKYRLVGGVTLDYRVKAHNTNILLDPFVSSFIIKKQLSTTATEEERFVFKINDGSAKTFYAVLAVPAGQNFAEKSILVNVISKYTVTDMKSNWRYENSSPSVLTYEMNSTDTSPYVFEFISSKTRASQEKVGGAPSSKDSVTNFMSR